MKGGHLIIFLQRGWWSQGGQRHDLCEGVVASIIPRAALDSPNPPSPGRARRIHLVTPQEFSWPILELSNSRISSQIQIKWHPSSPELPLTAPTPPSPGQARRMHLPWPQGLYLGPFLELSNPRTYSQSQCTLLDPSRVDLSWTLSGPRVKYRATFEAKPECTFPDP